MYIVVNARLDNLALLYLDHEMVKFESVVGKGKKQITFDQVDIPTATGYAAEDAEDRAGAADDTRKQPWAARSSPA